MNLNSKIDAGKIHILDIKTLEGSIECAVPSDVKKVAGHLFEFDLNTGLIPEEKIVGIRLLIGIIATGKSGERLSIKGSYTHEMIFMVENLDEFIVVNEESRHALDASLGSTLVSIIYSTVRGLIYGRTQSTSLGTVIIPVIAPLNLMGLKGLGKEQLDGGIDNVKAKTTSAKKKSARTT